MMETESTMLNFVEIQLPLEFIKDALIHVENDDKFVFEKKGVFPTHQEQVSLSFVKLNTNLKMTFNKLRFITVNGVHQCILNDLEDKIHNENSQDESKKMEENQSLSQICSEEFTTCLEKQQKSLLQEDVHSLKLDMPQSFTQTMKRKRGRPRKIKPVPSSYRGSTEIKTADVDKETPNTKKSDSNSAADSLEDTNDCKDNTKPNFEKKTQIQCLPDRTELCSNGKRYCLRGKKLNSQIMALVKGFDENFGTNDSEDVSEKEDETLLMSDNKSDEVNRFKRIEKKVLHKNNTDSKENKNYIREIKNKVEEILKNGNKLKVNKECGKSFIHCNICDGQFCSSNALYEHVLEMHESSENVDEYLQEILKSGASSKFKESVCCFCDEAFIDSVGLKNHQATVHKDTGLSCPLCDHKGKNLANLKIHVRNMHVEVGKKAFCHLCTASFRSHGSLKQHIDLNHYGNKYVSCDICKKEFYNKSQLRRHMRAHGLGGPRSFDCEICGKSFSFEYNLKRHNSVVHQPQSECFHCSYCGKGFSQKVPMISHVQLVHFNLFPYTCKECRDSFPKAVLLKEHMQTIHHQANFEVPVIPKNSVYDKTEEDRFYCSYCNESFTHKIRLIEHMHGDHADAFPFKCDTCVQGFIERSFLVLHMLKAHGVLIQNEEEVPKHSESAGEIMQIITTKSGFPNKVVQAVSGEEMLKDNEGKFQESSGDVETVTKNTSTTEYMESVQTVPSQTSSSLLVEVAQGSNTYQYVIEAPESLSQSGSELVVQDIANLLIAAEKTVQEGQEQETEPSSIEEISLVIDDSCHSHRAPAGNDAQTVEVLHGQNDQNTSLFTTNNQSQPMEVVIDQTEQNSAVFTIENQAQTLQIEHGDIIELNDSNSDGRNFYKIINVLDNH